MSDNQEELLQRLSKLLAQKKSKKFYAEKLQITEQEVDELLAELRNTDKEATYRGPFIPNPIGEQATIGDYIGALEDKVIEFEEDIKNKKAEITIGCSPDIKDIEDLIKRHIDTDKWDIDKYIQGYWGNPKNPNYHVKAWLSPKKEEQVFQQEFLSFVKSYIPKEKGHVSRDAQRSGKLLMNKQDAHLNKYDIYGKNEIIDRFEMIENANVNILERATTCYELEKVIYVLGSDQFNSEWNNCTTKGTPQANILSYHEAFELICDHETSVINDILCHANELEILYVAGNHDEYVGWHMVNYLKAYFKEQQNITFDTAPFYRKYLRLNNTAVMFDHGAGAKPKTLASQFPMEFKDEWSKCDYFYCFTGHLHHETSIDFNGIKFYQIPSLSNAKSRWDDKFANNTPAEMTAFLITESNGMGDIYKEIL